MTAVEGAVLSYKQSYDIVIALADKFGRCGGFAPE
jgi:hypothetical protein